MRSRQRTLRAVVLICAFSVCSLWAQSRLTVDQLVTFVRSSIQLKHPDKQVAGYLLKLKLSEHLDLRTIEELQGMGVGPSTMEALRKLVEISATFRNASMVLGPTPMEALRKLVEIS